MCVFCYRCYWLACYSFLFAVRFENTPSDLDKSLTFSEIAGHFGIASHIFANIFCWNLPNFPSYECILELIFQLFWKIDQPTCFSCRARCKIAGQKQQQLFISFGDKREYLVGRSWNVTSNWSKFALASWHCKIVSMPFYISLSYWWDHFWADRGSNSGK